MGRSRDRHGGLLDGDAHLQRCGAGLSGCGRLELSGADGAGGLEMFLSPYGLAEICADRSRRLCGMSVYGGPVYAGICQGKIRRAGGDGALCADLPAVFSGESGKCGSQ